MSSVLFAPPVGTQLNRGHPINRGLIGCWLLNEGAGQTYKDIAGVSDGSGISNPTRTVGAYGDCVTFSGALSGGSTVQYIQAANFSNNVSALSKISMSAWVKNISGAGQASGASGGGVCGIRAPTGAAGAFYIALSTTTNGLENKIGTPTSSAGTQRNITVLASGIWNHIALVYDGATLVTYVNGASVDSAAAALGAFGVGSLPFWIGKMDYTPGIAPLPANFPISNVRFYGRALSAQDVRQLYSQPFAGLASYRSGAYNLPNSTYTASLSDTAATSDTFAASGVFAGSLSDSTATSDSFAVAGVFASALSDAGATSDLFSAAGVFAGALNDAAATSDTWAAQAQFSASLSDTAATSDILAASAIFSASLSDAAATSDTWSAQAQFSASLDDTAITSDAWSSQAVLSSDINDIIATSDQFASTGVFLASISDVAVTSDRFFVVVPTLTPSRFGTMAVDVRMALMPVDARSADLVTDVRTGIMPRDQ